MRPSAAQPPVTPTAVTPRPAAIARAALAAAVPAALALAGALAAPEAQARIVRLEIVRIEPAFGGRAFGPVGAYERIVARAHGELDPGARANASIQDLALAPRNAAGRVEYVSDVELLRPADRSKANGVLFFNVTNRGNKGALSLFNADVPPNVAQINALTNPGDGFLQSQGYTMVWFGWQGDVLPGADRMLLKLPVARNADGSSVTGIVRSELIAQAPTTTLPLTAGWFTGTTHAPHPSASTDNRTPGPDGFVPMLTVRSRAQAAPMLIPNEEWSFGACPQGGAATPSDTQICLPRGFRPGWVYELRYRARDPQVLGIGFAVARDLGAFLRHDAADDTGAVNPVRLPDARTIVMGSSQSGRFIRSFLHRGFNRDERGRVVFDGAIPHIGGGLMPLDVRFGQPGRSAGTEQVDNLFPGTEFPFAYGRVTDPLTGRTQGILDRCQADRSCPKIVHAATALEVWELRQSLGFTDPLGLRDLPEPANVRSYIMASTQHAVAPLPLPRSSPFGPGCQQQSNPNPQVWTMRALLQALVGWIREGTEPPPSARPTIADGTLVAPDQVRFPTIPANAYGGVQRPALRLRGVHNPMSVQDYGPGFRAADTAGVLEVDPPRLGTGRYNVLVAQVDADGNDLGGVRGVHLEVPIGTYTGWNHFVEERFEGGFCTLQGSFVPFAATRDERLRVGDARPSIEERYPTRQAYVDAVRTAAQGLVARRLLLPQDAQRLIAEAERDGVRTGP
jgi:hypothetical protein